MVVFGFIILLITIILSIYIRVRMCDTPLERDEGEYAYAGQLLLQGIPPYQEAYNMKLPGVYFAYAVIMKLFGETIVGIRIGLLIINLFSSLLILMIGKHWKNWLTGILSAIVFLILSLSPGLLGTHAHATHFLTYFALTGYLLLLQYKEKPALSHLVLAGISFGCAFLCKQHGIFFILLGLIMVIQCGLKKQAIQHQILRAIIFIVSTAVPFGMLCAWLSSKGLLNKFYFWTFQYAQAYIEETSLISGWANFKATLLKMVQFDILIWVLFVIALIWLVLKHQRKFELVLLLVFSFLTVIPGLYFRQHYFITFLPAVALIVGLGLVSFQEILHKTKYVNFVITTLVVLIGFGSFYINRDIYFTETPAQVSRSLFGVNPFVEAYLIADYIKEITNPADKIAVIGSEPEIYFYTNRKSATGYIYTYGLMENTPFAEKMQGEMISEIEFQKPKVILAVSFPQSWLRREDSNPKLFNWLSIYLASNYQLSGIVESLDADAINFHTGNQLANYHPASPLLISVYTRK